VAAHWPARPPLRRAARWDGVFPEHAEGGRLSPAELEELLAEVREHRERADPFDVVMAGRAGDLGDGELDAYAEVGLTWWLEAIMPNDPLAEARERIAVGPPRSPA
jgi:hypothetical protein